MSGDLFFALKEGILALELEDAQKAAQEIVESGKDIEEGIRVATEAIRIVGDRFGKMEIYLPELMLGADVMKAAVEILEEGLTKSGKSVKKLGKVVLGTVKGDIHDIGKTLVATMLSVAGFDVVDIGIDATVSDFVNKAENNKADIIGMSSLLTTSQSVQREVIKYLRDANMRENYYVIVGGGSITPEWAEKIGADGYAEFASSAVELCDAIVKDGSKPPFTEPILR